MCGYYVGDLLAQTQSFYISEEWWVSFNIFMIILYHMLYTIRLATI